ncbi:putative ABC transporter permease subunit [Gudongella sp. DL1XJH-153]|uniref:putative ABC transporter permease subunit n=1 Tax=Gudongella sp. DL1XJH-153 TaxID=3409804 RepID=UPI003BB79237
MNRKLISLIRTDLNITFGLSSLAYNIRKGKKIVPMAIVTLAILSLLPSYILVIRALGSFYDAFRQIGQQSFFLHMGFMSAQLIVLVLGFMYVMSKYYFSNDLPHLVPLPIKPSHIIGSKFVSLMVSEYLTSLPVIIPFIIIYGTRGNVGIDYWLISILAVIALPVLPLVISSVFIMIFMKYTNIKGKKDLIRIITALVFIALVIFVQLKLNQWTTQSMIDSENFMFNLARDANLLLTKAGIAYPPAMWGALALSKGFSVQGVFNLFLFIGSGLVGFALMMILAEKIFFDGLIGNIEVSASKGRGKKLDTSSVLKIGNPIIAIAKKEILMIIKTPVYLMNSVGGVVILPILLVISMVTGGEAYEPMKEMILQSREILVLGSIAVIGSFGVLNALGATTFSREGTNMWIQRTLPIDPRAQVIGRTLPSVALQVVGGVLLIGGIFFIVPLNIFEIMIILLLGISASVPLTMIGMTIDIIRPMIEWTNPQQAMKQNLNVLISMAIGTLFLVGAAFLGYLLLPDYGLPVVLGLYVMIIVLSTVFIYKLLIDLVKTKLMDME